MNCGTNIIRAEVAALYVNGARIAHVTDVTLSTQNALREIVGESSVRTFQYGLDSWQVAANGFVTFVDGYSWDFLMSQLDQFQYLTIKIPTNESGTDYLQGSVLLRSQSLTAGNTGEMIKMSLDFQGSGPLQRVFTCYGLLFTDPYSTIDGAGCATEHPQKLYLSNQSSYPYVEVGDQLYTDSDCTTPYTGQANQYVGISNLSGAAYRLDNSGIVTAKEISACNGSGGEEG